MTSVLDTTPLANETIAEPPTQRQTVKALIANGKKSPTRQEHDEFTKAWIELARQEGLTDESVSLLFGGFRFAGAEPLFSLMDTDEACLAALGTLEAVTPIRENSSGASFRIYVHLFALAANAGRNAECITAIALAILQTANNKKGSPFGTNPSYISKYLLKRLVAERAEPVLASVALPAATASQFAETIASACEETRKKAKPAKGEAAAVDLLESWLRASITGSDEAKAPSGPDPRTEKRPRQETVPAESDAASAGGQSDKAAYGAVVNAVLELEAAHQRAEAQLSAAEKAIGAKDADIKKLEEALESANERADTLKEALAASKRQISAAEERLEVLQGELERANQTASAQAETIAMLEKGMNRKGDEALARIASRLRVDYADFKEYEHDPMTVELGEIARLQIGQMFDVLKSAGVKL